MKTITIYREIRSAFTAVTGLGAAFFTALVGFSLPATAVAQQGSAGAMLEEIVQVADTDTPGDSSTTTNTSGGGGPVGLQMLLFMLLLAASFRLADRGGYAARGCHGGNVGSYISRAFI